MDGGITALLIIAVFIVGTAIVGILPGIKQKMDLENWAVGGRNFGRSLNWFVLAGEVYTAFAFLGNSGWAYTRGGPTYYILAYMALAYLVSFFILPTISKIGHANKLMTQPDFIKLRYQSRGMGILVAVIGVIFVLPYLQLQLTALGIVIETCSYGAVGRVPAMIISFLLVAAFVYVSGLKGVASTAVIKDIVLAVAVVFFGLYLPIHYFGGIGDMFQALNAAKPGFLSLPGATTDMNVSWFISTVLLTTLGFYMWPHLFADSFSAKNPNVLKHNAVYLPLYTLCLIFPMIVGFTALMIIPGLDRGDLSFLTLVGKTVPGWLFGIIGGAGALAAMVPAADLLLSSSMLLSHNVYKETVGKQASEATVARIAKGVVLVLTLISLYLAVFVPNMLVNLLLTGYSGITQMFPLVVLGLFWKKANKWGAVAGLMTGEVLVFALMLTKHDPIFGLNAGFVALVCNAVVMLVVSALTTASDANKKADPAVQSQA